MYHVSLGRHLGFRGKGAELGGLGPSMSERRERVASIVPHEMYHALPLRMLKLVTTYLSLGRKG